ncbi:hypothetical protein HG536_0B04590 [Torulaspora globosa]|uniref:Uncharacterized protein n=1 Tax=Torulaspora globosa TaxID=48254 RepID=A0A7G3ZDK9_9SACH|nr:uncharacterized protein HG536_0B04590 [Torulaspora globosa]QLL31595.1 hypothetical protein HG536_0B04590 [Torulaspora globosa]
MPGQIESIPFLSQIEDVDKYLLEYRSLKLATPGHSSSYSSGGHHVQGQARSLGSEVREVNVAGEPAGSYNGAVDGAGSYGNGMKGTNFSGSMGAGRKKYVGNANQYRKYGVQYSNVQQQNTMIANHFKQVYPQMGYNGSGSGSNLSLDQLSASFMMPNRMSQQPNVAQTQQGYPSGASSPSPVPSRVDTTLSGGSSISSYTSNAEHASASAQFGASHASQFQNFLDPGLVSSSSIVPGISSNTNIYNLGNGDLVRGYSSSSLVAERNNSAGTPLGFEPGVSTPVLGPEPISSDRVAGEVNLGGFDAPAAGISANPANNMLMSDYPVGWGSNHATTSSNTSGAFGIWNNDMSVWS